MKRIAVVASIVAVLLSLIPVARADELTVLSAGTMHFALKDVGDNFTRTTGTKLAITFSAAGGVKTKVEKGEPVDVVILLKPDIAALVNAGKIAPDSVHDIARTALSIAVRKGQPKPDISSLAGVKEALLAAKTIAYYDAAAGGAADGILAERDVARLGIANEIAAKVKLWKSVQEVIDEKSVDLLVGWQPPLLSKADYEFIGPLPPELQDPVHSTWSAGATTKSADLEKAKAFTQMLVSPESLEVFKSKGFTPP